MKCKICNTKTYLFIGGIFDDRHGYPGRFDIYRCPQCDFYSTHPEPTGPELDRLYTDFYPRKGLSPDQVQAMVTPLASLKDRLSVWAKGNHNTCHFYSKPGMRVLDYGCGVGVSLIEINNLGAEAFGIEVDENVGPIAEALNLKIHIGSLESMPYPDHYFDLITLNQVIEHIPDPVQFLKALKAKLKQDGKIMLSFPNANSLTRKMFGRRWLHWHVPYHLNHFSKKSTEFLLKQAGLRVTSIKTVTPNLWTMLQFRSLLASVEEGERNTSWDLAGAGNERQKAEHNVVDWLILRTINFLSSRGKLMLLLNNRLIDILGRGDSFVVEACID